VQFRYSNLWLEQKRLFLLKFVGTIVCTYWECTYVEIDSAIK